MAQQQQGEKLSKIVEKLGLELLTPDVDYSRIVITQKEINRPALQITGYFEHFQNDRIQIIGKVEYTYMKQMERSKRVEIFKKLFSYKFPGMIFCRGYTPDVDLIRIAEQNGVPLFRTQQATSQLMGELIQELNERLAPCIAIHGVLVDISGTGVLIMGESGIGKSEAALELIRRGHRLVADDVVEIHKVNERTLVGTSTDITRNFLEVRGIGIIDVKELFGIECIKEKQGIDMVIKLEEWKKEAQYDRLGLEEEYTEFMGIKVVCQSIPIRPGRSLAVICEVAAVNFRQKRMGYNAAKELTRRVEESIRNRNNLREAEDEIEEV
jgi:HPr kinase/phosphorylase